MARKKLTAKQELPQAEWVPIGEVELNPDNPRTIRDERFKKLVKSLKEFPEMLAIRPIVVNADGMVLGGNKRREAAEAAGMDHVPVIRAADLTPEQEREFIIKDNVGFGDWAMDVLLDGWDREELEEWGLDDLEWPKEEPEAEEDDFEAPEEVETDIVLGDLIEIGRHRLLCGDSTNADDVERLLGGDKPRLMVTDPPYGVEYDPEWRKEAGINKNEGKMGKVQNDDRADWTETWSISPADVAYVWHAGKFTTTVQKSLEQAGFVVRNQIIWSKDRFALSRGNYHWQHEPCWYAIKKGKKSYWAGDRSQSTLWQIGARDDSGVGHGTQKPIEAMSRPIKNHEGDVYYPFLGSGTTMVASHQLERKCYGMEIDPKYCQIIIDRMLALDSALEVRINGKPYEQTTKNNG